MIEGLCVVLFASTNKYIFTYILFFEYYAITVIEQHIHARRRHFVYCAFKMFYYRRIVVRANVAYDFRHRSI